MLRMSAKTGEGVEDALEAIVQKIPPPAGDPEAPPRALIFDSIFDQYRGVVAYVRVVDGTFCKGDAIKAMQAGTRAEIDEIGFFSPDMVKTDGLEAGEVGYIITGIKDVAKLRVGDTLTTETSRRRAAARLPRGAAGRLLRPLPDRHRPLRRPARRAREAGAERRRALVRAGDLDARSASASAAASSACCTWTSCASGSSASTGSSCWRRRPTSSTA